MKRNGTTAAPIADFFVIANPADRPMMVAKVKNMPTTATKNNGRRPNLSTLTEEVTATIRLKMAVSMERGRDRNVDLDRRWS
jgi:hypothetical protein